MAGSKVESRNDIHHKLRARYGHSISEQEVDLITRAHARHGAVKVGSFLPSKHRKD